MATATATTPLTGEEHSIDDWFRYLADGRLTAAVVGLDGRAGLVPAALLLGIALALAIASTRAGRETLRPGALVGLAVAAWLTAALAAPHLLPADAAHGTTPGTLAVVLLVVTVVAGLALVERRGPAIGAALAPLLLLLHPEVYTRQRAALLVVVVSLGLVASSAWATRPRPLPVVARRRAAVRRGLRRAVIPRAPGPQRTPRRRRPAPP